MKSLIFCTCLLCSVHWCLAQDCTNTLSGQVRDFHDQTLLSEASIFLVDHNIEVTTNAKGRFQIKNLCPGTYILQLSHPECQTVSHKVELNSDTELDLSLEHHLEELEEVHVLGKNVPQKSKTAQEVTLKAETLEDFGVANLGEALKTLPGISTLNTGAQISKPSIHGLIGSRVLILNDNVRMQDQEWGDEHAPNVDISSINSVSIVKGAAALQYGGDAIGGTIILEPAHFQAKDSLFGSAAIDAASNGRGGKVSAELTRSYEQGWFWQFQGSYKRLGDQEAPDYVLSNTGVEEIGASFHLGRRLLEWGFDFKYSYYNANIGILRSSNIGNTDDLIRAINNGDPLIIDPFTHDINNPQQKVDHHLVKLDFYKRFEGLGKWSVQYDFQFNQRKEFDLRRGGRGDIPSIDLELTTHTLSSDFKFDAKSLWQFRTGVLARYQENFADPDTGVRRLIPNYDRYELGVFALAEYRPSASWLLDAAVRLDHSRIDANKFYITTRWEERGYNEDFADLVVEDLGTQLLVNPDFDYTNLSAGLGLKWDNGGPHNVKFHYTLAQRPPNPAELFSDGLHHSAARIELGDLRIESELSNQFSVTYQFNNRKWKVLIEPYLNLIDDFIYLTPTGTQQTVRGAFPVWEYLQTDARLLGADLDVEHRWNDRWSSNFQFAIVKGKDRELDEPLINIPAANFRKSLTFKKAEWKDLEVSLTSTHVFEQNETPENIMVFSPLAQEDVLLRINDAPEGYTLFDLKAKATFKLKDNKRLTTTLLVNNIFDTNYRDYLNRQRFYGDDLGRNFIIRAKLNF